MGAGAQRWWEDPPFAEVRAYNADVARCPVWRLFVGGVVVAHGRQEQLRPLEKSINAARGVRTAYLESQVDRLRERLVLIDKELDAGETLRAMSDSALLAELARRKRLGPLMVPMQPDEAGYWGPSAFYGREYEGRFVTDEHSGAQWVDWAPDRRPRHPRTCRVPYCDVFTPSPEHRYCSQHQSLEDVTVHLEALVRQGARQEEIDWWRRAIEEMTDSFARMSNPGRFAPHNAGLTAREVVGRSEEAHRRLTRVFDEIEQRLRPREWVAFGRRGRSEARAELERDLQDQGVCANRGCTKYRTRHPGQPCTAR